MNEILNNIFRIEGRIGRLQYFFVLLLTIFIYFFLGILYIFGAALVDNPHLASKETYSFVMQLVSFFASFIMFIPAIKRMHDINISGWWIVLWGAPIEVFLLLLPSIGGILVVLSILAKVIFGISLLVIKGTEGENKYGSPNLIVIKR